MCFNHTINIVIKNKHLTNNAIWIKGAQLTGSFLTSVYVILFAGFLFSDSNAVKLAILRFYVKIMQK